VRVLRRSQVGGFVVYAYGLEMFRSPDKQPFMKKMMAKCVWTKHTGPKGSLYVRMPATT